MHRARVPHEICAGPGIGREELIGKQVALQLIAARAREYDVRRVVHAAMRERVNVIERRGLEVQRRGAVDAAAATIPHGRTLDRTLESGSAEMLDAGMPAAEATGWE